MIVLRDDQSEFIEKIRTALRSHQTVLACAATGFGKTIAAAFMADSSSRKGFDVMFTCHRQELIHQTSKSFEDVGIAHSFVAAKRPFNPNAKVKIASIPSLINRLHLVKPPKVMIIDECFPAGTLVDGRPIEDIRLGDIVLSYNEKSSTIERRRVSRRFKRRPSTLVTVHLIDGTKVRCTEEHPFYSNGQWVAAKNLKNGDGLLLLEASDDDQAMRRLRDRVSAKTSQHKSDAILLDAVQGGAPKRTRQKDRHALFRVRDKNHRLWKAATRIGEAWTGLLLPLLRGSVQTAFKVGNHGQDQQRVCLGAHEEKQSHGPAGGASEDVDHTSQNRPPTERSWRERAPGADPPIGSSGSVGLADGVYFPNENWTGKWIPNALQDRYRERRAESGCRGRRQQPFNIQEEGTGRAKNTFSRIARVDRVEVHKPRSDGGFGKLCPDGFVYNLEIEGTHTYFANGILVHNCHHCTAAGWAMVHKWATENGCKIVGLTATPWRLSGQGLGDYFEVMVNGPSMAWLIEQGFLSDYRVFAPSTPTMKDVHVRAGDFVHSEAEAMMIDRVLIGNAVTHYQKHARGKKGIAFCVSVRHSERVAEQFRASGVSAVHLDAKTPTDERRKAIRAYADGHIDVLTNVDLFGEGFDLSSYAGRECPIEAVSLLRPTMSLSLFLQQVGRSLRPKPLPAIILDHAGNFARHGFPDDTIEWSLADRAKRAKGKDGGDIPIRQCDHCYFVHRPAPHCPNCGHVYDIVSREVEEREGELDELDVRARRAARIKEQQEAHTVPDLIELGRNRGYKKPELWAAHVWTARKRRKVA